MILLKWVCTTGLLAIAVSMQYPRLTRLLTWTSPPRSGPSPQPQSQSCHHLTSAAASSGKLFPPSSIRNIGGGDRGGGRFNGLGGEGRLVRCLRRASFVGVLRVGEVGDVESGAACTSSNGEIVSCGTGADRFANGFRSQVGDVSALWRDSYVNGTTSMLSRDCRAVWCPIVLIEFFFPLRPVNNRLARRETSKTRDEAE